MASMRDQIRLAKSIGWNATGILRQRGVISAPVFEYLRRDRFWESEVLSKCWHWNSTIRDSRMAMAGFQETPGFHANCYGWKHRNPAIKDGC